jgi:hypothetical protein
MRLALNFKKMILVWQTYRQSLCTGDMQAACVCLSGAGDFIDKVAGTLFLAHHTLQDIR